MQQLDTTSQGVDVLSTQVNWQYFDTSSLQHILALFIGQYSQTD